MVIFGIYDVIMKCYEKIVISLFCRGKFAIKLNKNRPLNMITIISKSKTS